MYGTKPARTPPKTTHYSFFVARIAQPTAQYRCCNSSKIKRERRGPAKQVARQTDTNQMSIRLGSKILICEKKSESHLCDCDLQLVVLQISAEKSFSAARFGRGGLSNPLAELMVSWQEPERDQIANWILCRRLSPEPSSNQFRHFEM